MSSGYEYNKKWILAYQQTDAYKNYTKRRYLEKKKEDFYVKLGEIFDVIEQWELLQKYCEKINNATNTTECKKVIEEAQCEIK